MILPVYLQLPELDPQYINERAYLPYGLTVQNIMAALAHTHRFLHRLNIFLTAPENAYGRLEDMLLGNSFAGILSEVIVKNIARATSDLVANQKTGGFPDLLPVKRYGLTPAILKAEDGIEVKASKQSGGWQGHNAESGWYLIFRYTIDTETQPVEARAATQIVQVLAAQLVDEDWSFSGRRGSSRRTPTASINAQGMHKLRSNPVYQRPEYVVNPKRYGLDKRY